METTPHPLVLSPLEMIESFFTNYPAETVQTLLWRWFILSIKDEFSKLPPKEMQLFTDFFERLDILILAVDLIRQQQSS